MSTTNKDNELDFNQRIPGTGGDFIDDQDVEGHIKVTQTPHVDGGPEDVIKRTLTPGVDDQDVEGHRAHAIDDGSAEGDFFRQAPDTNPHGER